MDRMIPKYYRLVYYYAGLVLGFFIGYLWGSR